MKSIFLILLTSLALTACSKNEKPAEAPSSDMNIEELSEVHSSDVKQDLQQTEAASIQLGKPFPVTNDTQNNNLKFEAFETDLSNEDKYYYQLKIENSGESPIQINDRQIKLVDSLGKEHPVGLFHQSLNSPIAPHSSTIGIVAFDNITKAPPQQLKIND